MLTGFFSGSLFSHHFYITQEFLPTCSNTLLHQLAIKKVPTSQSDGDHFSVVVSSSHESPVSFKLTKTSQYNGFLVNLSKTFLS